jgi:hypothetical protein
MRHRLGLCGVVCLFFVGPPLHGGQESRRVLALYDSTDAFSKTADKSHVHTLLEMPLNHLGMAVDFADANARPLPDPSGYRAIVTWYADERMRAPEEYCRWLRQAVERGVRVVLIGGLGAVKNPSGEDAAWEEVLRAMAALGVRHDPAITATENPFIIEVRDSEPGRFGYETNSPPQRLFYERWTPADPQMRVWRAVLRKDVPDSAAVAVALGPRGGLVLGDQYAIRISEKPRYEVTWDLNPFEFLEAALDCRGLPRPDVTTVCGARAAFSHIDGDGMANPALEQPGPVQLCGRVMMERVLKRYPVPVTVGVISAYADKAALGTNELIAMGRDILQLPNVQPGCHGYAHTLVWASGRPGLTWPGYQYSADVEVRQAVEVLNRRLLGEDRKVEAYLWSGDCSPTEEAVGLCDRLGLFGINGGDSRYDSEHRSVTNIVALARPVGRYRQVYARSQNENLYTGLWTANFGAFRAVTETYERSESPLRLLPVNVYFHFYSAERQASLRAVQQVYDWCLARPLCWIHVAEYVASVQGFMAARCGRSDDGGYWIEDFAPCYTARLDGCGRGVDMASAQGVIGYVHHAGSLYVSLAPVRRAQFRLTDQPPRQPCLRRSTALLREVKARGAEWSAEARQYAPGFIELQGLQPEEARAVSVGAGRSALKADRDGLLKIPLSRGAGDWLPVRVAAE